MCELSNTDTGEALERERIKWENKGLLFAVMGVRKGHTRHTDSSFQQVWELGCGLFLLLLRHGCCRRITKYWRIFK